MKKEEFEKIREDAKNLKELPNKDLVSILDATSTEFEIVKNTILSLSQYLDDIENIYNTTLKEYDNRTNGARQ
jgi:hypothetical protein